MGKRELVTLLFLSFWCFVIAVWLFLTVPWVRLQFVLFHGHTHLLFFIELSCLNVKLSFLVVALYLALYAQY